MNNLRVLPARMLAALIALLLTGCTTIEAQPVADQRPDAAIVAALLEAASADGELPLIVGFATPDLTGLDDAARAAVIARERQALLHRLGGHSIANLKTYEFLPFVALTVDADGIDTLAADPRVISLEEDWLVVPLLDQSVSLIRADFNHIAAYTGAGQTIAVLDTGIDRFHPDLAGKVVSGACYSTNEASTNTSSTCPGGVTSSVAIGSSGPCDGSGCDHGTAVASIAAAVAPSANIISIQVFSLRNNQAFCSARNRTSPCVTGYNSDVIAGLNRVFALRNTYTIAAVNLSLGGGRYYEPFGCDNADAARRFAIQQLRDAGIITVAGSGNNGYTDSMLAPACLSNVISVAASDKSDRIADNTNVSAITTVMAPGMAIVSARPGTTLPPVRASANGSSLAAPHVAGVIALLRQAQPNATVAQIASAIQSGGAQITDNRPAQPVNNIPAGSVIKRRVDAFLALCQLTGCDADDFRIIQANQSLNGAINPVSDVDNYYFFGNVDDRVTIRLNRISGNLNPFLELFSPNNIRVAFNADGGGGNNSLINGYILPQSGRYVIRARGITGTGGYQLSVSRESVPLNPTPRITRISPASATATHFGSDFWVAIYGEGFMPESEVRWNGQLRAKFYSSPELIYIRVRGSDINVIPAPPRLAFVTVRNPTPGGGASNSYPFNVAVPFLGETELVAPPSGAGVEAGIRQTFVISWTHPTDSWRTMQRMDMRLRNPESGQIALWLRVVERPGPDSLFRLLDASAGSTPAGEDPDFLIEGVPGSGSDLVIPGRVTVHMDESAFLGSGQTATMTPTISFDPSLVGAYTIEFEVDSETPLDEFGNLQKDDVLGEFHILPPACTAPVATVFLDGPVEGITGGVYTFTAAVDPAGASQPLTYSWSPEPLSGQGTPAATYRWDEAGEHVIGVSVENCGGFGAGVHSVLVSSSPNPDLTIEKHGPATAVSGQPFTYTLTVANHGALTATNLLISDVLPAGVTYLAGGALIGNVVQWQVAELGGYGQKVDVTLAVSAQDDVLNGEYGVSATGGASAQGSTAVTTRRVDAQVLLTSVTTETLSYMGSDRSSQLVVPGGAVFADTMLTYVEITGESAAPSALGSFAYAGRAFRLDGYQENAPTSDPRLYETVLVSLSYNSAAVDGLIEDTLTLRASTQEGWQAEGIDCTVNRAVQRVDCTLATPLLTNYVLVGEPLPVTERWTLYLPAVLNRSVETQQSAAITAISQSGGQYIVAFQTAGFTPQLPGDHVHFFFDTVPPEQAGMPGSGPWYVYGGQSPFTGYGVADRPLGAAKLCVLVANHDHSVLQGSGNCVDLP